MIDQQQTSSSIITTSDPPSLIDLPIEDSVPQLAAASDITNTVCTQSNHLTGIPDNEINNETEKVNEANEDDMVSTSLQHSEIRKRATETYLLNANKRIKAHDQLIEDLFSKYSIGDYVGIKINKVDRTNTDPKILPTIIMKKKMIK